MADVAYLTLADELERDLRSATPGTRVPSEHELASAHGVSRITARAALQELEQRHLVHRRRGAGTFVALRVEYPISADIPPSFTETIRRAGHRPGSHLASVRRAKAPTRVRDALGIEPSDPVLHIRRLTTVDGQPASLHSSWVARVDIDALKLRVADDVSVYALLREDGFEPAREWYTAELDTIPADLAPQLGLVGRPQAWHTFSCNRCNRTGERIELSETWVRADVMRVRFELGPNPPTTTEER